jgi:hypothetical protein
VAGGKGWWRVRDSNPRPRRCERRALPTELTPHGQTHVFYTLLSGRTIVRIDSKLRLPNATPLLKKSRYRISRGGDRDPSEPAGVRRQTRRQASRATLARLLAPARRRRPPRGLATIRVGTWLKHEIPIRTFTEWDDARPGFLEIDLVAHCGPSTQGFYLCTLCAVDIATAWVELEAVWGKGQARVGGAIEHVRRRLPLPLLGLDSDNGSEFINQTLYAYCQRQGITFTRSRPWKKNDSAHVEQKNGASSAASSAMIASPPRPPMPSSRASTAWPACT